MDPDDAYESAMYKKIDKSFNEAIDEIAARRVDEYADLIPEWNRSFWHEVFRLNAIRDLTEQEGDENHDKPF